MKFDNLENYLLEYAIQFEDKFKEKIIEHGLHATDNLYNSFSIDIEANDTNYQVIVDVAPYLKFIESGRKPNSKFPPLNAIRGWIQAKGIVPRQYKGVTPTNNQLAYLIGRSIAEKGVKPKPILSQTKQELQEDFMIGIRDAITKDVNIELANAFKNIK